MSRRPCLDCGRLHSNPSRCDHCQSAANVRRGSATQRGYGKSWQALRKQVLAEWLTTNGAVCPGWNRPRHASDRLTVDHIRPKAKGGTDERENLSVLCHSCNSAKRDSF